MNRFEFEARYGTERQCIDAIVRWRWPDGFVCPKCGHDQSWVLRTKLLYQCIRCRRQTSATAGTVFDSTKIPLQLWFVALYHMSMTRGRVNSMELSRYLDISYNAAWRLRRKVVRLLKDPKPLRL